MSWVLEATIQQQMKGLVSIEKSWLVVKGEELLIGGVVEYKREVSFYIDVQDGEINNKTKSKNNKHNLHLKFIRKEALGKGEYNFRGSITSGGEKKQTLMLLSSKEDR